MDEREISERQQTILAALISEYVETAEPVGSDNLVEKYNFDFSPATARNEMAALTKQGLLQKDHSSAGRSPTPLGFRYYIKNGMREKELPVVNEVSIKQRLWDQRHDLGHLLREATHALSDETQNLSVITTDDGLIYSSGSVHILRHPEFYDIDVTRTVLHLLDHFDLIENMMQNITADADFGVLLGEEMGIPSLNQCGMIISRVDLPQGKTGHIALIGPYRLDYANIIPAVRYMQHLVNELCQTW